MRWFARPPRETSPAETATIKTPASPCPLRRRWYAAVTAAARATIDAIPTRLQKPNQNRRWRSVLASCAACRAVALSSCHRSTRFDALRIRLGGAAENPVLVGAKVVGGEPVLLEGEFVRRIAHGRAPAYASPRPTSRGPSH